VPFCSRSNLQAELWLNLLEIETKEICYQTEKAGIKCELLYDKAIIIKIHGFNDSLRQFLVSFLTKMVEFDGTKNEKQFQNCLAMLKEKYVNFFKMPPYKQVMRILLHVIFNEEQHFQHLCEELDFIGIDDFKAFNKNWLKTLSFEWLITGNLLEQTAIDIAKECEALIAKHMQFKVLAR